MPRGLSRIYFKVVDEVPSPVCRECAPGIRKLVRHGQL